MMTEANRSFGARGLCWGKYPGRDDKTHYKSTGRKMDHDPIIQVGFDVGLISEHSKLCRVESRICLTFFFQFTDLIISEEGDARN
jgi:hypothetical protein